MLEIKHYGRGLSIIREGDLCVSLPSELAAAVAREIDVANTAREQAETRIAGLTDALRDMQDNYRQEKRAREQAARELEQLRGLLQADPKCVEMHFNGGELNAAIEHPSVRILAEAFQQELDKMQAENYIEFRLNNPTNGNQYLVTLHRPGGLSPHQLRQQAERDRDGLLKCVDALREKAAETNAALEQAVGVLRKHQWSGTCCWPGVHRGEPACLACGYPVEPGEHAPDCRLTKAIGGSDG